MTDKTLDEVWHHFRTTHLEFVNNYQDVQNYMTFELAKQIDRILIRAFFYAKLEKSALKKGPLTWGIYLGQFISVTDIARDAGRDELREYLVNEFGFKFETEDLSIPEQNGATYRRKIGPLRLSDAAPWRVCSPNS